jgi:hypothetical protein
MDIQTKKRIDELDLSIGRIEVVVLTSLYCLATSVNKTGVWVVFWVYLTLSVLTTIGDIIKKLVVFWYKRKGIKIRE